MTDGKLLAYMGDDAAKWAAEFCKIARDLGHDIDEGWMIGWFANAIEHSSHIRKINAFAAHKVAEAVAERDELIAALRGVVRVADRKTDEFDRAHAALAKANAP